MSSLKIYNLPKKLYLINRSLTGHGVVQTLKELKETVLQIEKSEFYIQTNFCKPFLTKHKFYQTISQKNQDNKKINLIMIFLSYCDGKYSFLEIVKKCKSNIRDLKPIIKKLLKKKIIKKYYK